MSAAPRTGVPRARRPRLSRLAARARAEGGFGLVELLISLTVLNVGIFATLSAFSSGYVALNRSKAISSASVLVDTQMERFRALSYQSICLSTTFDGWRYVANAPGGTAAPTCSTSDPAMVAMRNPVAGPDGGLYRVDTYVVWRCIKGTFTTSTPYTASTPGCITGGAPVASPMKLVRIVVRDDVELGTIYAREESTFDESTGL